LGHGWRWPSNFLILYAVSKTKNGAEQSFNAQVFNITVQQQVNQAFANIIETVAAERNCLKSVLGVNPKNLRRAKVPYE